jgi:putative AlgH/UPF0301 family transcriptional regulator
MAGNENENNHPGSNRSVDETVNDHRHGEMGLSDTSSEERPEQDEGEGGTDAAAVANQASSNTEATASTGTAASTRRTQLHNRLLTQQRSNILLQVLFHHMLLNNRRRREEEEEALVLAANPPPLPDRVMPVLSSEEALATNQICRFCFEGGSEEDNALVAPCNCSGGSRWVHLKCLRTWQRLQARNSYYSSSSAAAASTTTTVTTMDNAPSTATTTSSATTTYTVAGYICNVCNSPYLTRPPAIRTVRQNVLKRGTFLVAKQETVGRTFQRTVILLLSDTVCGNPQGAFGLIINAPLPSALIPSSSSSDVATNNNNNTVEWRRGGPVCGGRLGVVNFAILHTYPPTWNVGQEDVLDVDIDEEYFDDDDDDDDGDEDDAGNVVLEANIESDTLPLLDDLHLREAEEGTFLRNTDTDTDDDDDAVLEDDDDDIDDAAEHNHHNGNDTCAPLSLPVFDIARNNPPLQFVASRDSHQPATFSQDNLQAAIQRLVESHQPPSQQAPPVSDPSGSDLSNEATAASAANSSHGNNHKILIFSGYCKWRAGQLEREIQREVWDVCVDGTPDDILRNFNDSNNENESENDAVNESGDLWQELINSENRLLSWQRVVQEEEEDDEQRQPLG